MSQETCPAARVRREQAAHQADRGRLAAAVRSEKAEDLAVRDLQRHVVDDMLVAEALVEIVHVDGERAVLCAHRSVTETGWPGCRCGASSTAGCASIMNTSFARLSLL